MKLRLQDDSVRLRLSVSEVRNIGSGRPVTAQTRFPGSVLAYRLVPSHVTALSARLEGATLTVRVPREQACAWAGSDQVSLHGCVDLHSGGTLRLLVEKDFACLAPRAGEDPSDLFVNPGAEPALS